MLKIIGWTVGGLFLAVFVLAIGAYVYFAPSDEAVLAVEPATERTIETGTLVGARDEYGTFVWRGIPFATPPVGDKRWRQPERPEPWNGLLEATAFAPACPQRGTGGGVEGDEDCLYLNVWAPADGANALPVMVWIHGGGNSIGSAATSIYHGARLAGEHDLVVVSIQYRLGPLGWFRHPALAAGARSPEDASGNYGTLDIIESLEWIQRNIAVFGGDPDNVTIFGESAGGFNVLSMVVSPLAEGLFHRAISQSGGLNLTSIDVAENYLDDELPGHRFSGREIVNALLDADRQIARTKQDAMKDEAIAARLRELTPAEMIALYGGGFGGMIGNPDLFGDGHVLPGEGIYERFEQVDGFHRVPMMLGTNRDESKLFTMMGAATTKLFDVIPTGAIDQATYDRDNAYSSDLWRARGVVELADRLVANGHDDVYGYRFDVDDWRHLGFVDLKPMLGAAHALEIPFVFGNFIEPLRIVYPPSDEFDELSSAMRSYWAAFARSGDPNAGNTDLPRWPRWSATPETIVFDTAFDGGIRAEPATVTEAAVRERFLADRSYESQASYCDAYRGYFSGKLFRAEEFATLGGQGCPGALESRGHE